MQLNLPILDHLAHSRNILIAGAGGGFDVFAGLPLYFALQALGKTVHLANYSFADVRLACRVSHAEILQESLLVGVSGIDLSGFWRRSGRGGRGCQSSSRLLKAAMKSTALSSDPSM